jgi:hypothetical protein
MVRLLAVLLLIVQTDSRRVRGDPFADLDSARVTGVRSN